MKKTLLISLFFIIHLNTFAQINSLEKFAEPAHKVTNPAMNSLGKYNSNGKVDLYTGKINVNIPLYDFSANSVKIPVSLTYNTDGIKVNDRASWVGTGFQLSAESYIYRERRGNADESSIGRFAKLKNGFNDSKIVVISKILNKNYSLIDEYTNGKFLLNIDNGTHPGDMEPDIFHFNFLGETGYFVLDSIGKPQIIEGDTKIRVVPSIGPMGNNTAWLVTLPSGEQLTFPNNNSYTEAESYQYLFGLNYGTNPPTNIYFTNQGTSKWLASKITALSGDTVSFQYTTGNDITDTITQYKNLVALNFSEQEFNSVHDSWYEGWTNPQLGVSVNPPLTGRYAPYFNGINLPYDTTALHTYNEFSKVIGPKYISKINFPEGTVVFSPSVTYRRDLPNAPYLNNIQVKDKLNNLIKTISFVCSYFQPNPSGGVDNNPGDLRLRLDSVIEQGTNNARQKYSFEYNTLYNLPNRNAVQQDYLGYFNNNHSRTLVPTMHWNGQTFIYGDRSFDVNRMQANILTKVIYPTGGWSAFFYEMNSIDPLVPNAGSSSPIGGLRVKKTQDFNGANITNIVNYTYARGCPPYPAYNPELMFAREEVIRGIDFENNIQKAYVGDDHLLLIHSTPFAQINLTKGGNIGYGTVTASMQGNGKTIYTFTSPSTNANTICKRLVSPTHDYIPIYAQGVNTMNLSYFSKEPEQGLIKSKSVYDESGNLVQQDQYTYNFNYGIPGKKIWGFVDGQMPILMTAEVANVMIAEKSNNAFDIIYYQPRNIVLATSSSLTNTQNGLVTVSKNYTYNDKLQLQSITTSNSKQNSLKSRLLYPYDMVLLAQDNNHVYQGMVDGNILSPLIKKIDSVGNVQTLSTTFNYKAFGSKYLPALLEKQVKSYTSIAYNQYNLYDSHNNVLEMQEMAGGTKKVYLWGYHGQHLVAEITGADFNAVKLSVDTAVLNNGTEAQIEQQLSLLRTSVNSNKTIQLSTYTYSPLVGMISETSPTGNTTFYEYDSLGRLTDAKDQNGNIIKYYNYHYKTQ